MRYCGWAFSRTFSNWKSAILVWVCNCLVHGLLCCSQICIWIEEFVGYAFLCRVNNRMSRELCDPGIFNQICGSISWHFICILDSPALRVPDSYIYSYIVWSRYCSTRTREQKSTDAHAQRDLRAIWCRRTRRTYGQADTFEAHSFQRRPVDFYHRVEHFVNGVAAVVENAFLKSGNYWCGQPCKSGSMIKKNC